MAEGRHAPDARLVLRASTSLALRGRCGAASVHGVESLGGLVPAAGTSRQLGWRKGSVAVGWAGWVDQRAVGPCEEVLHLHVADLLDGMWLLLLFAALPLSRVLVLWSLPPMAAGSSTLVPQKLRKLELSFLAV